MAKNEPSYAAVLTLLFCLLGLLFLLFFLYKKLNKDANGEYTIHRIVYKEGGVRDRMTNAALALETRLGVRLWPRSNTDEEGEEMQEVQYDEKQMEEGNRQGSDSNGEDHDDDDDDEEEEEEEEKERTGEGDDTSCGNSSLESLKVGETARLTDQQEAKGEMGEKREEKEVNEGDGDGKGEASGGAGLLIDIKQFSGSATWSAGEVCRDGDVTAL